VIQTLVRMGPHATAWTRTSTVLVLKTMRERRAKDSKRTAKQPHVKVTGVTYNYEMSLNKLLCEIIEF